GDRDRLAGQAPRTAAVVALARRLEPLADLLGQAGAAGQRRAGRVVAARRLSSRARRLLARWPRRPFRRPRGVFARRPRRPFRRPRRLSAGSGLVEAADLVQLRYL